MVRVQMMQMGSIMVIEVHIELIMVVQIASITMVRIQMEINHEGGKSTHCSNHDGESI